ncbi:MAG: S8 family serine peptidase [Lewinellaceae bacterium]|nr:S8 family serine peptidase [Lewinellaceae bacterium]
MKHIRTGRIGLGMLFLFMSSLILNAQMTEGQKKVLMDLSDQYKKLELARRAEVEAYALRYNIPLQVRDSGGQITAILDHIDRGHPVYIGPDNAISQTSLSVDAVKTGGELGLSLTGAGQTLGIWEAGGTVRTSHQEFGGRVVNLDGTASSDHATHVAGTMIAAGVDPAAEGFSEAANLRCYDASGDIGEMAFEAANTPIRVSNHSYGAFAGWDFDNDPTVNMWRWYGIDPAVTDWKFGAYDSDAQSMDNVAFNAPFYLIVKSAGNDRNDNGPPAGTTYLLGFGSTTSTAARNPDGGAAGYDCIPTDGNAKNILTVGAANPVPGGNGYTGPTSVTMSSFSGWGPTDDGRIKPDVVADGVGLYSSSNAADTAYTTKSGTSMAAPSTSGSVGLLLEHWQNVLGGVPRAATMKALLINEADEVGPNNGPDYSFGWGQINVADAAQLITIHDYTGCQHIVEASVDAGDVFTFPISSSGSQPLKISLVWSDPASGTVNSGTVNPAGVNYLVNDLDLRLDGSSSTFFPWILNPASPAAAATTGNNNRDNVEQILVLSPAAGDYTIRVVAPASLTSGPQQFSLIISGNDATVENASFGFMTVNDDRTYAVRNDLTFGPAYQVVNPGDVKAYAGHSITMQPGFRAVSGSKFLARIMPGGGCGIFTGDLKSDNYPTSLTGDFSESRTAENVFGQTGARQVVDYFRISPNPASDVFSVQFSTAQDGPVSLWLTDQQGRVVQQLQSQVEYSAGEHAETFSIRSLAPGTYYCILQTADRRAAQPLMLIPR